MTRNGQNLAIFASAAKIPRIDAQRLRDDREHDRQHEAVEDRRRRG